LSLAFARAQIRTSGSENQVFVDDLAIAQADSTNARPPAQDAAFALSSSSDALDFADSSEITRDDWLSNIFAEAALGLFGDPWA
jgi:hypothetical protein